MAPSKRWRYVASSVTGTSHLKTDAGCQDAFAVRSIDTVEGAVLILAVSDGAGSARAGEIGSRIAVDGIVEQAAEWLRTGRLVAEIDDAVMREWLKGIREEIAERASEAESEMRDFAATLLCAILSETHSAFAQLGDGAIVVLTPELEWSWVFWPMHGEYANTTYFVTDEKAVANLQFESRPRPVHEVAAFSDGLEPLVLEFKTKAAFQPFFSRMFRPLRGSSAKGRDESLVAQLAAYLRSPAVTARADDDLTLVLATRLDDAPPQLPPVSETSDARDNETTH